MKGTGFDAAVDEFFVKKEGEGKKSEKISKVLSSHDSKGEKTLECPECKRKFKKRYNLKIHQRNHTGETPFVCSYEGCNLKFKWRSSLMNHQRYHAPARGERGGASTPVRSLSQSVPNMRTAGLAPLLPNERAGTSPHGLMAVPGSASNSAGPTFLLEPMVPPPPIDTSPLSGLPVYPNELSHMHPPKMDTTELSSHSRDHFISKDSVGVPSVVSQFGLELRSSDKTGTSLLCPNESYSSGRMKMFSSRMPDDREKMPQTTSQEGNFPWPLVDHEYGSLPSDLFDGTRRGAGTEQYDFKRDEEDTYLRLPQKRTS